MSKKMDKGMKFLVADDHSLIRQGIVFLLEELELSAQIIQASSLHQVLEKCKGETIDIAIIDAHFPDGNSLNIISELKQNQPDLRILIFTGIDEDIHALKFVQAGVNGFLSKLSEEEEIKEAIVTMCNGGEYLSAAVQKLLVKSLREPSVLNPLSHLTEREIQIADLYAKGYGNLEIANLLQVKQNTISTTKKRIFDKLKISNIVDLAAIFKQHQ